MSRLFQQSEGTSAQRRWFFSCVDDTDGKTPETGLTFSGAELQISKNGAAFGNFGGSATELTDGMYYYEATSGELDTLGALGFKVEKSGVRLVLMEVGQVVPWDPYLDFTALIDTEIAAIKAKTDNLPSDPADASDIAASFSTVNTKLDTIDDFLDTEIAAIKAKTDNLPSDPADASDIAATLTTIAGYVDTEVATIVSGVADIQGRLPAALVSGRIDASVGDMDAGLLDDIAAAVWGYVVEGSYTAVEFMRGFAAILFGESNGNTTNTRTYRDTGDTTDRVTATVTSNGRTAVTLDLT